MLLESYKNAGLLFNQNFLEQTSEANLWGYRGELVLKAGDIADAKGHSKPPIVVMRGVALLADDKLKLVIGAIDNVESLPGFIDKFQGDFSSDLKAVIFAVNISEAVQIPLAGVDFTLIPLVQGVPWNEMIDELALEKSDFKGQSAADKILTLLNELKGYKPKYRITSLDEVLAGATETVREGWGAV